MPRLKDGSKSEHQIQKEIIDWLESQPDTIVNRRNAGVAFGPTGNRLRLCEPGLPDLEVFMSGGTTINLEVKSQRGRLTASQQEMFPKLEQMGHIVYIVRSLEDVKQIIKNFNLV